MASPSPKSTLQEVAVRSGKPLPVYNTSSEGPDHDRRFISTCLYDNRQSQSTCPQKTKRSAEASAAKVILDELTDSPKAPADATILPCEVTPTYSRDKIAIVDLDNYDIPIQILQQPGSTYLLFVSKTCTKPVVQYRSSGNCMIFVTPCVGKDATDVYMTYEAHGIRQCFPDADIAVVTRDHFGATLAYIMNATYVCNDSDFIEWSLPKKVQQNFIQESPNVLPTLFENEGEQE